MKRFKHLRLVIDGSVLQTTPIELPEDGSDIQCPACLQQSFTDVYAIVQHGFIVDDCLDIIKCNACCNFYHVQYTVKA